MPWHLDKMSFVFLVKPYYPKWALIPVLFNLSVGYILLSLKVLFTSQFKVPSNKVLRVVAPYEGKGRMVWCWGQWWCGIIDKGEKTMHNRKKMERTLCMWAVLNCWWDYLSLKNLGFIVRPAPLQLLQVTEIFFTSLICKMGTLRVANCYDICIE